MKYRRGSFIASFKPGRGKVIAGDKVRFREKRLSDVRNDHNWQSDAELAKLDATPVVNISFPVYLLDYTEEIRYSGIDRYTLALETLEGKHIGNCTIYDINDTQSEAQLGIMIGDRKYWDKGLGTDAVNTIVDHIFLKTSLKRIYLMTLDWNMRAQKCFKKCGFTPCREINRDGNKFVVMELLLEQWQKQREFVEADA
jgi:RimJ/RimL family protein N-acetyltransferase